MISVRLHCIRYARIHVHVVNSDKVDALWMPSPSRKTVLGAISPSSLNFESLRGYLNSEDFRRHVEKTVDKLSELNRQIHTTPVVYIR